MKQWFLRFTPREQLALLLMTAAVTLYALFMLLVAPLGKARDDMASRNDATAELLARVDGMAAEISALREADQGRPRGAQRNLTALVNSSAERYGLRPSRLQPNARGAVQVRFEAASLAALLRWIHDLEANRGLAVEELSMSQTSSAGMVSVTARIAALQ